MQVITAPISRDEPQDNRAAIVANLQNALLVLLRGGAIPAARDRQVFFKDALQPEQRDLVYGDITQQLVALFQEQFRQRFEVPQLFFLVVTGNVDAATAGIMNAKLAELEALRVVSGKVTNRDDSPLVGNLLFAFDKDNIGGAFLGSANTNEDGAYVIFYDPSLYARPGEGVLKIKEIIDLVVQVFDAGGATIAESESLHNPGRGVEVNLKVGEMPATQSFVLRGQVTDTNRRGLSDYEVILSEYDLDGPTQIQRTVSRANGAFDFEFNFNAVLRQGDDSTAPDLVFQVLDPAGAEKKVNSIFTIEAERETTVLPLSDSKQAPIVLMNVDAHLELRILVDSQPHLLTEFEQLVARLSPFMRQVGFADLKEDETSFQISFLNIESGVEKTKIERLRTAFQLARESESVPAWVFFGIQDLTRIASMTLEELASALKPLQPASDQSDLDVVAKHLQEFAKEHSIQTQISDLKSSVRDLIQPILGAEGKLDDFLGAYVRHEGDTESFWKALSEDANLQAEVPKIQLNLQLSQLTLNNSGLVQGLQQKGIENTRQLVDLSVPEWEALALEHKAEMPSHITGETDVARAQVYAQELQTLVELAFPTDVIKKSIQEPDLNTFLNQNPAFDFTRTPVETYLHGHGEPALEGIENTETVKTQLRQIQRLYTVTANTADMNVLRNMQYESAHQISNLAPEDFVQSLAGKVSEENAYLYHTRAMAISDASTMVFHQLRDLGLSSSPLAAKNLSGDPSALQVIPDWESLFGSLDMCECQHCKSVYSPAAYFVDLLHILLGQNKGVARKEIFRRRPDLMFTKLSCEHTETLIPYIDLVNEVLETYVTQNHVGDADSKSHAEISTNDTSSFTTSDLAANPQHPNPNAASDAVAAYQLLKDATFPLILPFDMNLETARQFLQEQNSSRFDVMKTFGDAESQATRAEGLRISESEFRVLTLKELDGVTDAGIDLVKDLWGSPSIPAGQTLGEALANVNIFLERTGIAYTDLISLLSTRFLNPNFPINAFLQTLSIADRNAWLAAHPEEEQLAQTVIELGADANDPCNLGKTFILHLNGEFLSDDELSRFNRFIRLWKKLGCTIGELDGLLTSLKATELTPQVIRDLSILWQIQESLRLSLDRLPVLVGDIPTIGKDSLYARLFLNKAILQIDDKFALNVAQTELDNILEILDVHVPAILAAFRISEEELRRIVQFTQLDLAADVLNLTNLSKLYRYVVLARGLRIKIKDLITWLSLVSPTPWTTTAGLLTTWELLGKLLQYGFKAADLAYIFQDARASGHTLPPTDELITQSAKTLREGLQKVRQESTPNDGAVTAEFLKKELGILLDPEEVNKLIGILDGSNTRNPFSDLLTPKVSDNYKRILQNYLTPADVADLAATADVSDRLKKYWTNFEKKLSPVLRETFVQQHLIAAFKVEASIVALMLKDAALLQVSLDMETDTPIHAQAYAEQYVLMHKFTWLAGRLKLSGKELSYFENNPNFGNFNWKSLDFELWLRLAQFVALRDSLPPAESDLIAIFETAQIADDVTKAIIDVTGWDSANVNDFVNRRTPADFLNEVVLISLQRQIALSEQIGVSIEKLESWATDVVTPDQSQDIKRTLKAKYDEVAWIEVSTEVHNRLRSQLRDALVACLLQKPEIKALGLRDANDLYSYFLIDVEMDSCMQTSRLKQAIGSVQLFVQRCLLNLESPTIVPKQIDAKQWKWMKNYRVWEANRKVFLYPENWIEPELRDNKSPFFKELESELLQAEVTNESVEKALGSYLEKLYDVARLDICGIYEDTEYQELHVFGRTFSTPPQYFYRKLDLKTQVWAPWDRVQLDIQGNEEGGLAGVHLIPLVWNRRLYLIWPILSQKTLASTASAQQKYWQIKLGFSEYSNSKWLPKKTSSVFLQQVTDEPLIGGNVSRLRFNLRFVDSKLEIDVVMTGDNRNRVLGKFVFNNSKKTFEGLQLDVDVPRDLSLASQGNFYQAVSSKEAALKIANAKSAPTEVLKTSQGFPTVLNAIVQQGNDPLSPFIDHSFFYQDSRRNYYVEPEYWMNQFVPSLQDPLRVEIPKGKAAVTNSHEFVKKVDAVAIDRVDRFNTLSSTTLNQIFEKGNIAASTALQVRSMQTMSAPISALVEKTSLSAEAAKIGAAYVGGSRLTNVKLAFKPFFHAYVNKFLETLNKDGIEGLLTPYNQQYSDMQLITTPGGIAGGAIPTGVTNNFKSLYSPNKNNVAEPYPMEDVDFSPGGAYSLYNWELFFHVPMLLANRLSKNQRFEEALRWYHFVFNPTTNENLNSSARFWQVIPFRNTPKETLESLLRQLQNPAGNSKRSELENAVSAWRNNPFSPHLIARMRLGAYQKNTVMKYLDNLIAWADNLFRQDTIESINEATQLYILAAELLGKRPEKIPARGKIQALNYAELEAAGLDAFSNVLVKVETTFPFYNLQAVQQSVATILNTTVPSFYFCLPNNDKLLGYWDTVADRLFKIRHCQNIEGLERQLALFEPPIDPALLVRAVAGGVDISSVLADLNSPLPHYRFAYIAQKAVEICAELKSLGSSLLSALEKKDGEALSIMRSQHEVMLLGLVKTIRKLQVTEAQRSREGLEKTRAVTEHKANYYAQLIKGGLSAGEKEHQSLAAASMALSLTGQFLEMSASVAHPIPDIEVGAIAGPAGGVTNSNRVAGGDKAAKALSAFGRFFNMLSSMQSFAATSAHTNSVYQRRADDWKLQNELANKELAQIDKQILGAQIREQIGEQELNNIEQQIENARQVEDFMRNKYTQEELYGWMIGEISTIYFQCYQLAYDLAKKAEKTYRYELGLPSSNFVQFGVWDSFRKGLLSGERLYLSLKQMEKSFMDQNRREYEITKHVSLLQHKPLALIQLRETGTCTVELPEALFDVDYPGHYMRRLKAVRLSIPCVVGPYTSLNCTLTLLRSKTRISAIDAGTYAEDLETENPRVTTNFAALESIATSSAQNDSGLFELNFRDERYLPFEGSGAISVWRLELPKTFRQFDYDTISDVILHLNYTSRAGGVGLQKAAVASLKKLLQDAAVKPQARLFSLRHEFPSEWHRLRTVADNNGNHKQAFSLHKQRFPLMFQGNKITINGVEIFGVPKGTAVPTLQLTLSDPEGEALNLQNAAAVGLLVHRSADTDLEVKNLGNDGNEADWLIQVKRADVAASLERLEDIMVLCHYSVRDA